MKHTLFREQQLSCDLGTAWKFFSSANNLSEITPDDMGFIVLTEMKDDKIYEGMLIDYYISPLLGIKMKWQTEIIHVDFQKSFIDLQKKGPYKLWKHHHEFISNEEGVLMKDTVEYELPFGVLGEMAHDLFVRKKLDYIFDYRFRVLSRLF